jgi:hypothetical protein
MTKKKARQIDTTRHGPADRMAGLPVSRRPLACLVWVVSSFCSAFNIELKISTPDQLPSRCGISQDSDWL